MITSLGHCSHVYDPLLLGVHLALKPDFTLIVPGVFTPNPTDPPPGAEDPTLLQSLCAAGVNCPPPTLGLLGNFGTGVKSTLPVIPTRVDVRFVLIFVSTIL